jgi:terminase small subunit-like protein
MTMPGPLRNARHERFAQELAKGKSKYGAYKAAGYSPDRGAAVRLSANASIAARVADLKKKAAERTIVSVADIAQQLDEDREFARELESPSAAVSATMGKAKVLGLLVDKTEVDLTTAGKPLGLRDFYGSPAPKKGK